MARPRSSLIVAGGIQLRPVTGDPAANVARIAALGRELKAAQPELGLLVAPELAVTGYSAAERFVELAEPWPAGASLQTLSALAAELDVVLIAGYAEAGGAPGLVYDAAAVFERNGRPVLSYRKTHCLETERRFFANGDELPIVATSLGELGLMICWDAAFPEVARTHALAGAELLVTIGAWEDPYVADWELAVAARAFDNVVPHVAVNRTGPDGVRDVLGPLARRRLLRAHGRRARRRRRRPARRRRRPGAHPAGACRLRFAAARPAPRALCRGERAGAGGGRRAGRRPRRRAPSGGTVIAVGACFRPSVRRRPWRSPCDAHDQHRPATQHHRRQARGELAMATVESPTRTPSGISGIEVRSIDWIPDSERHGKVWHQGPFWFLGNFQYFTIPIGFIGPSLGSVAVAGRSWPARSASSFGTHLHGLPRHAGAGARPAADDPVARPVRLSRRRRAALCHALHLHGLQRRRPGAARPGPARHLRLERERRRGRGHGRRRRCLPSTATTGCTACSAGCSTSRCRSSASSRSASSPATPATSPATRPTASTGPASWPSSRRRPPTT